MPRPHRKNSARRSAGAQTWLPESDADQNPTPLFYEFHFCQVVVRKGEKRIVSKEAVSAAANVEIGRPLASPPQGWLEVAANWQAKLADFPALTRRDIAARAGLTTARVNQILSLTSGAARPLPEGHSVKKRRRT